jgi:hypothetical protein
MMEIRCTLTPRERAFRTNVKVPEYDGAFSVYVRLQSNIHGSSFLLLPNSRARISVVVMLMTDQGSAVFPGFASNPVRFPEGPIIDFALLAR